MLYRILNKHLSTIFFEDVVLHIIKTVAALTIQRNVRKYFRRRFKQHRKHYLWPILYYHMSQSTRNSTMVSDLETYTQIRDEWRQDPMSWIVSIRSDDGVLDEIHDECKLGLWGKPCRWEV